MRPAWSPPATCWPASSPRIRRRSRRDSMLPPAAVAVVARALAKNPEARFADGRELAEALRALPAPALTPLPTGRPPRGATADLGVARPARPGAVVDGRTRRRSPPSSRSCWCRPGCCGATSSRSQLRLALRVILLFSVAAGVSVRLHLWFVARYRVGALARERRVARPWLVATNLAFVGALAVLGLRAARHARRHGLGVLRPGGGPCRGLGHGGAGDEPGVHGAAR